MLDKARKALERAKATEERLVAEIKETQERVETATKDGTKLAKKALSKVRREITPPKTEKVSGLITNKIYLVCHNCEAKLGPITEGRFHKFMDKLEGASQAGVGVMKTSPTLVLDGLSKTKDGLMDSLSPGSPDGRRPDIKAAAGHWLAQCQNCGRWNCHNCYESERSLCHKCA